MSKQDAFIKIIKQSKKVDDIVPSSIEQIQVLDVFDPESATMVQTTVEKLKRSFYKPPDKPTALNVVYKVVYPDDLNLKPASGAQKPKSRAGRPKKSKIPPQAPLESLAPSQKSKIQIVSKTRSGREVKFPKYIQADFKKIEIDDDKSPASANDCDIKITDFVKYKEKEEKKEETKVKEEKPVDLDSLKKKRSIAAQYRCPKCEKAYLGRNKILEHLRKNPSHGPMHQNEENHFEVWNYLVSITQKCPSSERGPKFCQELSNLLHNLLLLTNALFKKLGSAANEVKIDKVLGNAIGLDPGTYYFDDNNLYKDVTVLQLMGNTDFLNSIRSKADDNVKAIEKNNCNCGKLSTLDQLVLKSMLISSEANESIAKKIDGIQINQPMEEKHEDSGGGFFVPTEHNIVTNYSGLNDYEMKTDIDDNKHFYEPNSFTVHYNGAQGTTLNQTNIDDKSRPKSPKIKIQSNILICPPNPKFKCPLNPELLTDNSVLMSNLQHSVDELMLPVSTEPGNVLDNSSSSDEVMNVDQFVNERFRKITESDLEVTNGNSLNLDLPALDLFQFHTT